MKHKTHGINNLAATSFVLHIIFKNLASDLSFCLNSCVELLSATFSLKVHFVFWDLSLFYCLFSYLKLEVYWLLCFSLIFNLSLLKILSLIFILSSQFRFYLLLLSLLFSFLFSLSSFYCTTISAFSFFFSSLFSLNSYWPFLTMFTSFQIYGNLFTQQCWEYCLRMWTFNQKLWTIPGIWVEHLGLSRKCK